MADLEYFPVAIGEYREHERLDVQTEVDEVFALLAEFGAELIPWDVPMPVRSRDAVDERMAGWCNPDTPTNTFLYWVGHGWSDDVDAGLAHASSPHVLTSNAIKPGDLAAWLTARERSRHAEGTWAIVVVEACRSGRFVELVSALADSDPSGVRRVLLVGVTGGSRDDGSTVLGHFRRALARTLRYDFPANETIRLRDLAGALDDALGEAVVRPLGISAATLERRTPVPTGLSLDVADEIRGAMAALTEAERLHFVPKAQGGELGEVAWYFEGRDAERDLVCRWLRESTEGMFVVSGPPGCGKSAFLGNLVVHSRPGLRQVLVRHGMLSDLPASRRPADDTFTAVLHLTGATPEDVTNRTDELLKDHGQLTLVVDALDEAQQSLVIARDVLRPLAARPGVRLLIGTRPSVGSGPDAVRPNGQDLLDALAPPDDQILTLPTDTEAIYRYARRRLAAMPRQGVEQLARRIARTGNDFLYARLAVHEIQAGLRDDRLDEVLASDYRRLFGHAVARLSARQPVFGPLLEALGLARGRGLPKIDSVWLTVAETLKTPGDPSITDDDIADFIQAAAPYVMYDVEHGQTVYRLAHATFAEHFARPEPDSRHVRITQAIVDTDSANPYLTFHLAGHAAAGGLPAWKILADHTHVLDRLDPLPTASQALRSSFGSYTLPPEVAGLVGTQHLSCAVDVDVKHQRHGIRQLGAARFAGLVTPNSTDQPGSTDLWRLRWARMAQYAPHLTLVGHSAPVNAVTTLVLADGRTLVASASDDRTVRLWDLATGVLDRDPLAHPAAVKSLATIVDPTGHVLLACGDEDGTIWIWDPATGAVRHALPGDTQHSRDVQALVTFSANSRVLLAALSDFMVRIWDPFRGIQVSEIDDGGFGQRGFTVFTDVRRRAVLAIGASYGQLSLWDALTGSAVGGIELDTSDTVTAIAAFTDQRGHSALAISAGLGMDIWDLTEGRLVAKGVGNSMRIWSFAGFTGPGERPYLASAGFDSFIGIWNLIEQTQSIIQTELTQLSDVTVFPGPGGNTMLATGGKDAAVRIWDLRSAEIRDDDPAHNQIAEVTTLRDDTGRSRVVTGGHDHVVRIWDDADGTPAGVLPGHEAEITALAVVPARGGRTLLATASADSTVRVWDPVTLDQKTMLVKPGVGRFADVTRRIGSALAAIPGGTLLAVGCNAGPVRLWNYATGKEEAVLLGHRGVVTAIVPFRDPRGRVLLATSSNDATVRIWSPHALIKRDRAVLAGHVGAVYAIVSIIDATGRTVLASGGTDGALRLWDPVTCTQEAELTGHTCISSIAALRAKNGRQLLMTSGDATVRIWDPDTRACLATLPVAVSGHLAVTESAVVIGGYLDLAVLELNLDQVALLKPDEQAVAPP